MKVYLSKYRNHWISPYTILEKVFFWREIEYDEPLIDKLSNILNPFCIGLQKVLDFVHPKIQYVKIDYYDTWSMDCTLSPIILPMLKQLKATKQGSGYIDLEDVPENLRYTTTEEYDAQETFDFYKDERTKKIECDVHVRYDWALSEMIWAFEQLNDEDWEDQYWITKPEVDFTKHTEDEGHGVTPLRWKVKGECDWDGREKHQQRINNGLRLFGKYYQTLWD
jgi:hypothetical protein